ncbi:MAG: c-type cytochrome [Bosea sp. (in: a-proteobacteria)]
MHLLSTLTVVGGIALAALSGLALTRAVASQESKQVTEGRGHYMETCQLCHGEDGKRGAGFQTPIWGQGALIATKFVTAQGLIDYMQLMPFNDPTILDDNQKLAVVAFVLANHGTIKPSDTLDPSKAASISIK